MNDPVIMIPGLMCDARLFWHQIVYLSRSRPVTVALPYPGNTIEEISEHILAAAPPRFALVGHGLGAHVAMDLMRRDIARVTRVAFLSGDPLGEAPQVAAAREKRMVQARTGRLVEAMRDELPIAAFAPGDTRDEVMDLAEDMAVGLGEDVFVAQSRAQQRRRDHQKTLRRAMMPALILAGEKDGLVPVRRQSFMAELMPSAQVQIIEGAGHLLPLEKPQSVSRELGLFLNGPLVLR